MRTLLIQKLDCFSNFQLKKPQGKIPGDNINIVEWRFDPRGSRLAHKLRLEALCKNLIKLCHLFLGLGGHNGVSVRNPKLLAYGRLGGQMYPDTEGPIYQ